MSKWDAVEDRLTEKKTSSKKTVILCVVLGVVLACGLFVGGMMVMDPVITPIVQNYIHNAKEAPIAYDFYDKKVGLNETAIYFIGSSIVADAIYPDKIKEILYQNNYTNLSLYVLHAGADTPIMRATEIQKIIDSSPSLIIYGVTYRSVTDTFWVDERVTLVHDRLDIRPDSLYLFSEDEIKDIEYNPDLYYMKKYWLSSFTYTIGDQPVWFDDVLGYSLHARIEQTAGKDPKQIIKEANDPTDVWHPTVTNESTRHKEALIYNVQTLQNASIPVIIINMPLHPLTSEQITYESRQNFYDLLNRTGATWYDMEFGYGDEYFIDSHHMTLYGATQFAPVIADLIIQEVNSNAIHYA